GLLEPSTVDKQLAVVEAAPIHRHAVVDLLRGAWQRRDRIRLSDALYVELADRLGVRVLTTDRALARACEVAEVVTA
ncbi:MAG: type II toxin-antitoxin system VapC family toxin, partial [Acidimicrobiales bacterium]